MLKEVKSGTKDEFLGKDYEFQITYFVYSLKYLHFFGTDYYLNFLQIFSTWVIRNFFTEISNQRKTIYFIKFIS